MRSTPCPWTAHGGGGAAGIEAPSSTALKARAAASSSFPKARAPRTAIYNPPVRGIGLVVAKSSAPVVPIRVFGTFDAQWKRIKLLRPPRVAIKYGWPLLFEKLRAEAKADCSKIRLKEIYQEVADEIMAGDWRWTQPGLDG